MTRPRGFTLVELLVVLGIMVVLTALTLGAIAHTKQNAQRAQARAELARLQLALQEYHTDVRRYPRVRPAGPEADALLADQAPALCAALINEPTVELGGGPRSPYVSPTTFTIGVLEDRGKLAADAMGYDGLGGARLLDQAERMQLGRAEFLTQHGPTTAEPLVFLDPWGNPYHFRPWGDVRGAWKTRLLTAPVPRSGFALAVEGWARPPVEGPVADGPHDLEGYDLWSNGPNGVNELGDPASDDVVSWRGR